MKTYPGRQPRKVLEGNATVDVAGKRFNMTLADVSLGGVTLCSPTAIPQVTDICVLTFSIPGSAGSYEIQVSATITHCRYSFVFMCCRTGFQFQEPDEAVTALITSFLAENTSSVSS